MSYTRDMRTSDDVPLQKRRYRAAPRILLLELSRDDTVGGSHHSLRHLALSMARARFEPVSCFLADNAVARTLRDRGLDVVIIENDPRAFPASTRHPAAKLRGRLHDVDALLGRGVLRARKFLHEHGIDLLHQNNTIAIGGEWLLAAKSAGLPTIVHQRGCLFGSRLQREIARRAADRVICISRWVRECLSRETAYPLDRSPVVWNFVDTESFGPIDTVARAEQRDRHGVGTERILLGMVGNIKPWKGQHVVLEALALLPAHDRALLRCVFFGGTADRPEDKCYRSRLDAYVAEHRLATCVDFRGFVENIHEIYPLLDVLVHASTEPEPFGRVLIEAMACGVPVVASDGGGPRDIVDHGRSGWLVPIDAPRELASLLHWLVQNRAALPQAGAQARARAIRHFSPTSVMPDVHATYEALLQHRRVQRDERCVSS